MFIGPFSRGHDRKNFDAHILLKNNNTQCFFFYIPDKLSMEMKIEISECTVLLTSL